MDIDLKLNVSNETILQDITCSTCSEVFDTPKLLRCMHTFCEKCLETITKKEYSDDEDNNDGCIECPTCQYITKIPDGISSLTTNFILTNVIEAVNAMNQKSEGVLQCSECEQDVAVNFCCECLLNLCTICAEHHKRSRNFKGHRVPEFEDITWENMTQGKGKSCDEHGEPIKFFCDDCSVALCHDCTASKKHSGHRFTLINEIVNGKKEDLQDLVNNAERKQTAMQISVRDAERLLAVLTEHKEKSIKLVEATFARFKTLLDQKRDDLIKTLNDKYESSSVSIEKARNKNVILENWIKFTNNRVLDNNCNAEIMNSFESVKTQLMNQSKLTLIESKPIETNDRSNNETHSLTINPNSKSRPRVTSVSPRTQSDSNSLHSNKDSQPSNENAQNSKTKSKESDENVTTIKKDNDEQSSQFTGFWVKGEDNTERESTQTIIKEKKSEDKVELHLVPIHKNINQISGRKEMSPDDYQLKRKAPPRPSLPASFNKENKAKPDRPPSFKPQPPSSFKPQPPPSVDPNQEPPILGQPSSIKPDIPPSFKPIPPGSDHRKTVSFEMDMSPSIKPDRPPSFKPKPPPVSWSKPQSQKTPIDDFDDSIISSAWSTCKTPPQTPPNTSPIVQHRNGKVKETSKINSSLKPKIPTSPPPPPPPLALTKDSQNHRSDHVLFPIPPKSTANPMLTSKLENKDKLGQSNGRAEDYKIDDKHAQFSREQNYEGDDDILITNGNENSIYIDDIEVNRSAMVHKVEVESNNGVSESEHCNRQYSLVETNEMREEQIENNDTNGEVSSIGNDDSAENQNTEFEIEGEDVVMIDYNTEETPLSETSGPNNSTENTNTTIKEFVDSKYVVTETISVDKDITENEKVYVNEEGDSNSVNVENEATAGEESDVTNKREDEAKKHVKENFDDKMLVPVYSADITLIKPEITINDEVLELVLETVAEACSINLDCETTDVYCETLFNMTEEILYR